MCLISKKEKPIKCRANLKCYKVFRVNYGIDKSQDEFTSPFFGREVLTRNGDINGVVFEPGKSFFYPKPAGLLRLDGAKEIAEGYIHTFQTFEDAEASIRRGYFPSFSTGDCAGYEIFECVIPKGTEYYRGVCPSIEAIYNGFASKKIRIVKRINS